MFKLNNFIKLKKIMTKKNHKNLKNLLQSWNFGRSYLWNFIGGKILNFESRFWCFGEGRDFPLNLKNYRSSAKENSIKIENLISVDKILTMIFSRCCDFVEKIWPL